MVKSPTSTAKEEITKSFDKAAINAPADLKDTAQEDDVEPPPDNRECIAFTNSSFSHTEPYSR